MWSIRKVIILIEANFSACNLLASCSLDSWSLTWHPHWESVDFIFPLCAPYTLDLICCPETQDRESWENRLLVGLPCFSILSSFPLTFYLLTCKGLLFFGAPPFSWLFHTSHNGCLWLLGLCASFLLPKSSPRGLIKISFSHIWPVFEEMEFHISFLHQQGHSAYIDDSSEPVWE